MPGLFPREISAECWRWPRRRLHLVAVYCRSRSLPGANTDSFQEESLKAEEHQNDGHNHQARCGHHEVELNPMHRFEEREPQGERVQFIVLKIDQRTQEIVPCIDAGEQCYHY